MAEGRPPGTPSAGGRPARPTSSRSTLARQTAVLTTLVAALTVVITFGVSAKLIHSAADRQSRAELGHYADLVADAVDAKGAVGGLGGGVRALARLADVTPVRVLPDGAVRAVAEPSAPALQKRSQRVAAELPSRVAAPAAAGRQVDTTASLAGRTCFVVSRPLATGGSVVLVQPRASTGALSGALRGRLLISMLVGLVVAAAAGALLAQRLARPLAHAASAAWQLSHGRRDVRVEPEGPREVAAVADSLNTLAGALAVSEQRQREFLLSVSHELRTPLTAITGYAEALADGVVPPQETSNVGVTVLGESQRLERLVKDLLDLARLGAADFRVDATAVDLTALVRDAGAVWHARCAKEGVTLRLDVPDAPLVVTTDATRVRQIVDGLAENALRLTPSGAPIVFAVRRLDDASVELEVRDGGPGLTDEDIAVAFERSVLYDRYRGVRRVGTGVGLALIAGLASRLGGAARAGHAPEGGASFAVRLPPVPPPGFTER